MHLNAQRQRMRTRIQNSFKHRNRKEGTSVPIQSTVDKQLLISIRRRSLKDIVQCYINGADVDRAVDSRNGDNPLHAAIRTKWLSVVRTILLLFANHALLTTPNNDGETPMQLATSLSSLPLIQQAIQMFMKMYRNSNPDEDQRKDNHNGERKKGPVLLSLDGGGIRGLVIIRVLLIIERHLGRPFWPLIDWVAGTSTGAILASALAKGISLNDCQRLYMRLKNQVFTGTRPYSADVLERLLIETLSTESIQTIEKPKLLITAAKADVAPPDLMLFRNYPLPIDFAQEQLRQMAHFNEFNNIPLWKAVRCSSAAPTYFPAFDGRYVDGGVICNNPTLELLTEFRTLKEHFDMEKPSCVISCGTGIIPSLKLALNRPNYSRVMKPVSLVAEFIRNLSQILITQITESNGRPVAHSAAMCKAMETPFFRFSPPLSRDVRLNEVNDPIILDVLWNTEVALFESPALHELIDILRDI